MIKNTNFFFYKKFIYFTFFYLNIYLNNTIIYKLIYNFINTLKFLFFVKNFNIFIPKNIHLNKSLFYSVWKNGFITNFKTIKWHFVQKLAVKKLSSIIINLTLNKHITKEIRLYKFPLLNFINNHFSSNHFYDYFLHTDSNFFFKNHLDNIMYYLLLFKSLNFFKKK